MLLRLSHLSFFYGNKAILRNISLEIVPGTLLLLTGANGTGKSTLLRIMAGLQKATHGERTLGTVLQHDHSTIAYLGHKHMLYPDLSALENLLFWSAWLKKKSSVKKCMLALEQVELAGFAEEKVKGFSQGMAQRLALARTFLHDPTLILLDEPGSGLDTSAKKILRSSLLTRKQQGAAIILSSHDLEQDAQYASSVIHLHNQEMLFFEKPSLFLHSLKIPTETLRTAGTL